jgi:hypothetical protein
MYSDQCTISARSSGIISPLICLSLTTFRLTNLLCLHRARAHTQIHLQTASRFIIYAVCALWKLAFAVHSDIPESADEPRTIHAGKYKY